MKQAVIVIRTNQDVATTSIESLIVNASDVQIRVTPIETVEPVESLRGVRTESLRGRITMTSPITHRTRHMGRPSRLGISSRLLRLLKIDKHFVLEQGRGISGNIIYRIDIVKSLANAGMTLEELIHRKKQREAFPIGSLEYHCWNAYLAQRYHRTKRGEHAEQPAEQNPAEERIIEI